MIKYVFIVLHWTWSLAPSRTLYYQIYRLEIIYIFMAFVRLKQHTYDTKVPESFKTNLLNLLWVLFETPRLETPSSWQILVKVNLCTSLAAKFLQLSASSSLIMASEFSGLLYDLESMEIISMESAIKFLKHIFLLDT